MDQLQNTSEGPRGKVFKLPSNSFREDLQPLFPHQEACIEAFDKNSQASGIIHLPTGAGKTRVAIEIIARLLKSNPKERIVWATGRLVLIHQAMVRLVELSHLFPSPTSFHWSKSIWNAQVNAAADRGLLSKATITFLMRNDLTYLLKRASKASATTASLHEAIFGKDCTEKSSVTIVYDECHELGAEDLQTAWSKFHSRPDGLAKRIRVIGLSATPIPTNIDRQKFLKKIFPVDKFKNARPEWPALVHISTNAQDLEKQDILCPVNLSIQKTGTFSFPDDVLSRTEIRQIKISKEPSKKERLAFMEDFDRRVLSHEAVLKFLSDRLAANMHKTLGKTLVFVPSIAAANNLAALLGRDERVGKGNVTVVHSKMNEFSEKTIDDQNASAMHAKAQIEAFRKRKDSPCIMINVGMLTTGFDDPKIRTVVISRLVFSTNLFWQMIGRGLRGLRCGGTEDCNVIDPVRLTDRFSLMEGYKPKITGNLSTSIIDDDENEVACEQSADSHVSIVTRAPLHVGVLPMISSSLKGELREALEAFLNGGSLDPKIIPEIRVETITDSVGRIQNQYVKADRMTAASVSGWNWYPEMVDKLQEKMRKLINDLDLSWLKQANFIPANNTPDEVGLAEDRIRFVEKHKICTFTEYRTKEREMLQSPKIN